MSRQFIMVSSITYAMKAKSILKNNGIYVDIVKSQKYSNKARCSYSLVLYRNLQKAVDLLKDSGIEILEITEGEEKK
ncbi:MAG: putative Se/S carrier-like protein [Acutalibacteraceae bacterium]|nr:putative Se/S carrier-like protein [Acutalibacteraceae bacterium]